VTIDELAGAAPTPGTATRRPRPGSWLLVVAGLVVVCAGALWVTRSPIFAMRSLSIRGSIHVPRDELVRLSGLDGETNVLWMSPAEVRRDLERDPWVATVAVHRTLPGSVSIAITERRPIAVAEPGRWLIAPDGTVLGRAPHETALPSIRPGVALHTGARISPDRVAMRVAVTLTPSLRAEVARIDTHRDDRVVLHMRSGVVSLLGDPADLALKESTLAAILRWARDRGVQPAVVDVRAWSTPTLRMAS
jgi:cell division protein FtsQ